MPPEAVVEAMIGAGVPEWLAQDLAAQYAVFAAGQGAETSGDVSPVTGRRPPAPDAFARAEFAVGR